MTFKQNEFCKSLCDAKVYKKGDKTSAQRLNFLKKGILQNYQHHWYVLYWFYCKVLKDLNDIHVRKIFRKKFERKKYCRIVDNMPVTWCYDVEGDQKYCSPGFPIGCYVTKEGRGKDACVTSVSLWVFTCAKSVQSVINWANSTCL